MINLTIKAGIIAGTDIKQAAIDLINLSSKLKVLVEAEFKGYEFYAAPNDTMTEIVSGYHKWIKQRGEIS